MSRGKVRDSECYFCLESTYNKDYSKTRKYPWYTISKAEIVLLQSFTLSIFFNFDWDAVFQFPKTVFWSVEALQSRCSLARRRPQIGVFGVHPSGGKKVEVGGC